MANGQFVLPLMDATNPVRFFRLQAIVSLYQALGGGWQLDLADRVPLRVKFKAPPHP